MNILMIGFSITMLRMLDAQPESYRVTVIEEPDLYVSRNLKRFEFESLERLVLAEYQQSTALLDEVKKLAEGPKFDAVVPGFEYAVPGAAAAARLLGLPNAGPKAPQILTHKLRLREFCREQSIPHPRFAQVQSLQDLRDFYQGSPIVLKPANRQASLGVIKIDDEQGLADAWQEVQNIQETMIPTRELQWEYLAEDCMTGQEVSVEVLVTEGRFLFFNVTQKKTTSGRYSVELGHVVPALLPEETTERLRELMTRLTEGLQFECGCLHAEWMLTEEGPKLIECAGRAPGDSIFKMIELAYGFKPYRTFIRILGGEQPELPQRASAGAAIRYFQPEPGEVVAVSGLEELDQAAVHDWSLELKAGDVVEEIKNSWNRCGHVLTVGRDAAEAVELADELLRRVRIETNPATPVKQ